MWGKEAVVWAKKPSRKGLTILFGNDTLARALDGGVGCRKARQSGDSRAVSRKRALRTGARLWIGLFSRAMREVSRSASET